MTALLKFTHCCGMCYKPIFGDINNFVRFDDKISKEKFLTHKFEYKFEYYIKGCSIKILPTQVCTKCGLKINQCNVCLGWICGFNWSGSNNLSCNEVIMKKIIE